jgi:tripartite-type tricarboxylate transporter receptor subunit TctC
MKKSFRPLGAVLAAVVVGFASLVAATSTAQTYPARTVRVIVPFAPGGTTDVLGRFIAAELATALGQSFVVENVSGGGGNIGSNQVAKAAPDGYTLLIGAAGNISINPGLFTNMPYDPQADLAPVALMASTMNLLVVHPSVPAKSVPELIALAKASPGKLTYASAGNGSTIQLAAEMFKHLAGVDILGINYRGSGPAMLDLLAGRTDIMFENMPTALPRVQAGSLRALGVTGRARNPALPDVPTIAEAGLPDFEATSWFGVLAPARTAPVVIDVLYRTIADALKKPESADKVRKMGADVTVMGPEDFSRLIRSDTRKWGGIIKAAGITAN